MQTHIRSPTRKSSTNGKMLAIALRFAKLAKRSSIKVNPELMVSPSLKRRVRDRIKGEWRKGECEECEECGEESIIMDFDAFSYFHGYIHVIVKY